MESTAVDRPDAPVERVSDGGQDRVVRDRGVEGRGVDDHGVQDRGVQDQGADRRLGIRVISFLLVLCVFVIGWAAFRAVRQEPAVSGTAGRSVKPFHIPVPPPPRLVQQLPDSFTIPGTAPSIPWPSIGQAAVEIEGVGSLGTSGSVGTPAPIASVTKTMTAYLVLADHPLADGEAGPAITVGASEAAAYASELRQGQSLVKVYAGERISERDALEALMLASADNVAKILARWDAGSVSDFVASMNRAAKQLGMTHTTYTDPSGLDPSTVSTAPDQIRLAEAAMQSASFRSIVGLRTARIPVQGTIKNFNQLVGENGVIGVKTGSTDSAGGCLLFAATMTVDGRDETVIGAVLGQPLGDGDDFLGDTLYIASRIIEAARKSMASATIALPGTQVAVVRRPDAGPDTRLGVTSAVTVVGRPGQTYRVVVSGDPSAPMLEITPIGTVSAGTVATSVPLAPLFARGATAAE
jgi:D-alanyl-D-alanine carboxypeptidase (penicillin-binding protein 5/6)